jgi:hypothetical protein
MTEGRRAMTGAMPFGEVLEAADRLAPEDQEALVAILRRRIAERNRRRVADEVREARREHAQRLTAPTSVDDLMGEILS